MSRWACLVTLLTILVVAAPATAQQDDLRGVGFTLGAEDAPVTVVEYGDFACSACAEFARDTWPTLKSRYVDTGKALWRIIPFELGFRNSEEGARAAHCAAEQGAFWSMHDALFLRRDDWVGERNPKDALVDLGRSQGIDGARFEACYESDRMEDRIETANRAADRQGVRGTPTFLIDGAPVQGAIPLEAFVELIEKRLRGR